MFSPLSEAPVTDAPVWSGAWQGGLNHVQVIVQILYLVCASADNRVLCLGNTPADDQSLRATQGFQVRYGVWAANKRD